MTSPGAQETRITPITTFSDLEKGCNGAETPRPCAAYGGPSSCSCHPQGQEHTPFSSWGCGGTLQGCLQPPVLSCT